MPAKRLPIIVTFVVLLVLSPLLMRAPRGDGHPVLALPGFLASDLSMMPLRRFEIHQPSSAAEAAQMLGISIRTLRNKLNQLKGDGDDDDDK